MLQRLLKHFSRQEKLTTFVAIGALRVNAQKLFIRTHALALECVLGCIDLTEEDEQIVDLTSSSQISIDSDSSPVLGGNDTSVVVR